MITVFEVMLWTGVVATLYAYAGFPLLMALLSVRGRRPEHVSGDPAEMVTIIIPAYNEQASIGPKIRNTLSSDYPRHLLDVIVVSDASTDATNEIARGFEAEGVRLIVQPTRVGKTAGLNRAVAEARGAILVLTDANAVFASGTIGVLVEHLREPGVGLVSGYTRYTLTESGDVAEVTNVYTWLERIIKRGESRWGCCVGADGAIFAMRRGLYRPLRDDDINDFVLPLAVIAQGFRCVLAEDAVCSEKPGKDLDSEFRRQSRITNRTLRALRRNARLLNPVRRPAFAFFLFSHKVVRFLAPILLALSSLALLWLARSGGFYLVAAAVAVAFITAAIGSARVPVLGARLRPLHFVKTFITINVAVLNGWWKFLRGEGDVTWQHDRTVADESA